MLRLVARFPLCSVRQPRDLPDVTDAADEQKNKKIKQIERKKSNKKINQNDTAKKQKQQNLSPRQIFFLTPDIQEKLQLIKWTMFASVDKSESAVFCDTLPLYIARARY